MKTFKTIRSISLTILVSAFSVLALYFATNHLERQAGNFLRLYPPHPLELMGKKDLGSDAYYLAGTSADRIYLGNSRGALKLLVCDYNLHDTIPYHLQLEGGEHLLFTSPRVYVDSPFFYFWDGTLPAIYKGAIAQRRAHAVKGLTAYFTQCLPLSDSSYALRSVRVSSNGYELAKMNPEKDSLRFASGALQKQGDGFFSVDGSFLYDKGLNRLLYVYYYRNQFICLDTALNVLYRANTIDTFSTANMQVTRLQRTNAVVLSSPPHVINRKSAAWKNYLFVHSGVSAQNENKKVFDRSSVIDVYTIKDHLYRFSFYLPAYGGQKLQDFMVDEGRVVALYCQFLFSYQINPRYLKD